MTGHRSGRQVDDLTVYWKWSPTRNDGLAHAMTDCLGIATVCGEHMSIYGPATTDRPRCARCAAILERSTRR